MVSIKPQKSFQISHKIDALDLMSIPVPEEKSSAQLFEMARQERQQGRSGRPYSIDYHTRFSVPAACVVFAFISPVFAILFSRSGGFAGVLLSVFLIMLYFNAFVISKDILSKIPSVPDWVAGWLPNIVFMLAGILAARRLE